jgi:hypothetical protein
MSETKFTPGPWKVIGPYEVLGTGKGYYKLRNSAVIQDYEDWGFTKEDARLIAAAPDLYEALKSHHANQLRYSEAKRKANATCGEFKINPLQELIESAYMQGLGRETEAALAKARGEKDEQAS